MRPWGSDTLDVYNATRDIAIVAKPQGRHTASMKLGSSRMNKSQSVELLAVVNDGQPK